MSLHKYEVARKHFSVLRIYGFKNIPGNEPRDFVSSTARTVRSDAAIYYR